MKPPGKGKEISCPLFLRGKPPAEKGRGPDLSPRGSPGFFWTHDEEG
ncbi:hypothetical protein HMPREF3038_02282 [Akkermansia sp. KLE1797]|nr:hypothetical protein HMPREF3038_02282 [Akkermansia sp. KLE1797]KZA03858.1 hypothetical protein HMPREF1326_02398 [Akkermansia sp. KLE1605]